MKHVLCHNCATAVKTPELRKGDFVRAAIIGTQIMITMKVIDVSETSDLVTLSGDLHVYTLDKHLLRIYRLNNTILEEEPKAEPAPSQTPEPTAKPVEQPPLATAEELAKARAQLKQKKQKPRAPKDNN